MLWDTLAAIAEPCLWRLFKWGFTEQQCLTIAAKGLYLEWLGHGARLVVIRAANFMRQQELSALAAYAPAIYKFAPLSCGGLIAQR